MELSGFYPQWLLFDTFMAMSRSISQLTARFHFAYAINFLILPSVHFLLLFSDVQSLILLVVVFLCFCCVFMLINNLAGDAIALYKSFSS